MTAKSKGFKNTLFGEVDRRTLLAGAGAAWVMAGLTSALPSIARSAEIADKLRWLEYSHLQKPIFSEPFEKATGIELMKGAIQNDDTTLAMLAAGGTDSWDVIPYGRHEESPHPCA